MNSYLNEKKTTQLDTFLTDLIQPEMNRDHKFTLATGTIELVTN